MRWLLASALLAGSCGGVSHGDGPADPSDTDACRDHDYTPIGSRADYSLGEDGIPGFLISPPQVCEHQRAYIRIERTGGNRILATESSPDGGFHHGCRKLPTNPSDPSKCLQINALTILAEARERMLTAGLQPTGLGAGPCIEFLGDYPSWNMSVAIATWTKAEDTVRLLAEIMDEYDVRGFVGVAVVGPDCASEL